MNRGANDLLNAANRNLGRASFRNDLLVCVVCAVGIYFLLRFA